MTLDSQRMTCKTFDNSTRILFWAVDEFIFLAPLCLLGLVFKNFYLFGLALLLKTVYSNIKKKNGHQSISHYVYTYFPTKTCQQFGYFDGLPPSHLKEMLLI